MSRSRSSSGTKRWWVPRRSATSAAAACRIARASGAIRIGTAKSASDVPRWKRTEAGSIRAKLAGSLRAAAWISKRRAAKGEGTAGHHAAPRDGGATFRARGPGRRRLGVAVPRWITYKVHLARGRTLAPTDYDRLDPARRGGAPRLAAGRRPTPPRRRDGPPLARRRGQHRGAPLRDRAHRGDLDLRGGGDRPVGDQRGARPREAEADVRLR